MPSDAADQPSRNGKSPAKAQENGLPRDSENAVRHPADHEPDATDRPSPGGRFDQLPADAQAAYWRARDAGAIHYDALVVAIDYDENRTGLKEQ